MRHIKTFEALGGGLDMSSIDRMKAKYPRGIEIPKEVKATGSGNFKIGIDSLDKSSKKFTEIVQLINDLLLNTKGTVKVVVDAGASAVGTKGFDNQGLAERRRDKTIEDLSNYPFTDKKRIKFIKGKATVGKATVKNSPEAEAEQYVTVSVSGTGSINAPITGVQGDNTNVYRPELFKADLIKKNVIDDDDLFNIKLKRVCVQIPEQYVDDFKKAVWKFKNEQGLTNLPLGVYDIQPKK
jgi:hypothetical protein